MIEILSVLGHLVELIHGVYKLSDLIGFLRENPLIAWTLAVMVAAGAVVALLIRRLRPDDLLSIRK
jgi:hypothetical protein